MKNRSPAFAGLTLLTLPVVTPLAAESVPVMVVTATRTPITADQALAPVTVIDRPAIETSGARDLIQLLRGLAGIDLTNSGGPGKPTGLYLRGTGAGHTLLLIDGVRVGSATTGTPAWQDLPLGLIDRIEVVRGPHAALYGSDAIGGVVQIFTRRGGGERHFDAAAGIGSHQRVEARAALSGRQGGLDYAVAASHQGTDGIDARQPTTGWYAVDEPDRDGYRNDALSLSLGHDLERGGRLGFTLLHADGDNEYDGAPDESDVVQQVMAFDLRLPLGERWQSSLQLARNLDRSEQFDHGAHYSTIDTRRHQITWQNDLTVDDDDLLTLGLDWYRDQAEGDTAYTVDRRDNHSLFAQYQWNRGDHDLLTALRHDDNEQFGGHTTGNLAWGYRIDRGLRLTASAGTAFKAPTLNQLYWPGSGNPNLRPEESATVEAGLTATPGWGEWSLHAFHSRIDELIDWAPDASGNWVPQNTSRARIDGVELELRGTFAGWRSHGQLTLLDPRDRDSDNRLRRRADHTLRLDLDRDFGALSAGATLFYQGRRFDDAANLTRLGGYALLDLRAGYRLDKQWSLQATLSNALDRDYQTVNTYNQPGAELFVAIRYAQ
ncbi:TonB-dependent receptor domain-containing protein [Endothiovibrio diazotrophicus]